MIAYDGSLQAARAVQAFLATGLGVGKPVQVVQIGNGSGADSLHACRAVEFLKARGIAASVHDVRAAYSVAHALIGACRDLRAGLVVMGGLRALHPVRVLPRLGHPDDARGIPGLAVPLPLTQS